MAPSDSSTLAVPVDAHRLPTRTVGILGGMGPAVGADFVDLFVQACIDWMHQHGQAVNDQAFPGIGWRNYRCPTARKP